MPKDSDLQLVFFRSGPTDWDEADRVQGGSDLPLSAAGQASLADLVENALAELGAPPKLVISGPDEASARIAESISEHSGAKKRFTRTGTGKVKFKRAKRNHILEKHPKKMKRQARASGIMAPQDAKHVDKLLPN